MIFHETSVQTLFNLDFKLLGSNIELCRCTVKLIYSLETCDYWVQLSNYVRFYSLRNCSNEISFDINLRLFQSAVLQREIIRRVLPSRRNNKPKASLLLHYVQLWPEVHRVILLQ